MPTFSLEVPFQSAGGPYHNGPLAPSFLGDDPLNSRVTTYDIEALRVRPVSTYVKDRHMFCYQRYNKPGNIDDIIKAKSDFSDIDPEKKPLDIHVIDSYYRSHYNNIISDWDCFKETYIGVEYADKKTYLNTLSVLVNPWEFLDYAKLYKSAGFSALPDKAVELWQDILARFALGTSLDTLKAAKVQDKWLLTRALSIYQEIFPALERYVESDEYIVLTRGGEVLTQIKVSPSREDFKSLHSVLQHMKALVEENLDKLAMTIAEIDSIDETVVSDTMRSPFMPYLTVKRDFPTHRASRENMGMGERRSPMIPLIVTGAAIGALFASSA